VAYGGKDVRVIAPMDEAHDEPAIDSKRGLTESKSASCWKNLTIFEEPIGSAAVGMLMPLK
jgi:hypothetical protein